MKPGWHSKQKIYVFNPDAVKAAGSFTLGCKVVFDFVKGRCLIGTVIDFEYVDSKMTLLRIKLNDGGTKLRTAESVYDGAIMLVREG